MMNRVGAMLALLAAAASWAEVSSAAPLRIERTKPSEKVRARPPAAWVRG